MTIRRLDETEASRIFPRGGAGNLQDYLDGLRGLRQGDVAEAIRGDVSPRAFKRRLTLAAKQLGMDLRYAPRQENDNAIYFQVRSVSGAGDTAGAAAPKRRGRPPKNPRPE